MRKIRTGDPLRILALLGRMRIVPYIWLFTTIMMSLSLFAATVARSGIAMVKQPSPPKAMTVRSRFSSWAMIPAEVRTPWLR